MGYTGDMVELTDELVTELAAKFNTTEETIREQYAQTVAQGADAVLAEMDQYVAGLEADMGEVIADAGARWLHRGPDRVRNMVEFYQEGWDALSAEEVTESTVGDMFLKLCVALFKLAEAQEEIARLTDTNHRRGGK